MMAVLLNIFPKTSAWLKVFHFAITKLDEDDKRHVDLFTGRRHTRQGSIHPLRMMELDAGLFGYAIFSGDAIE